MGEVWPTAHITELCLQLTAGSRPVYGDEHRALRSQSCERALLTMGDFTFFTLLVYYGTLWNFNVVIFTYGNVWTLESREICIDVSSFSEFCIYTVAHKEVKPVLYINRAVGQFRKWLALSQRWMAMSNAMFKLFNMTTQSPFTAMRLIDSAAV